MKRVKKRYVSRGNPYPTIVLSGEVFLKYQDEEAMRTAKKGDVCLYLNTDGASFPLIKGDYDALGQEGFFKGTLYDGKRWQRLDISDFFSEREQYFGKYERPLDRWHLCREVMARQVGVEMCRTYREHYTILMAPL